MRLTLLGVALTATLATAQTEIRIDSDTPLVNAVAGVRTARAGGIVFVVWDDARGGRSGIRFNRSTDDGVSFGPSDTALDTWQTLASDSIAPQLAASDDAVCVVWVDDRHGSTDVYANASLDGGATWLAQDVRVDTDPPGASDSTSPVVACTGTTVVAAWVDDRDGPLRVFANRSADGGVTWLAQDVRLSTDPSLDASSPSLAIVGQDVLVVWSDTRGIRLNRSADLGLTWLADDVPVDSGTAGADQFPQVVATDTAAVVVWFERVTALTGDVVANWSDDGGVTWQPAEARVNRGPAGNVPLTTPIVAAAGNRAYVAWNETRAAGRGVFVNRSQDGGRTWHASDAQVRIPEPGQIAPTGISLAAAGPTVAVGWGELFLGQIYANWSVDHGASWLPDDVRLNVTLSSPIAVPKIAAAPHAVSFAWQANTDVFGTRVHTGCEPIGGGCAGASSPSCASEPSATQPFTITCPPPLLPCLGSQVVLFGRCASPVLEVPPPIGCGVCGLTIAISWGSAGDPLTIDPPLLPGFSFCVQCGCIATDVVPCISLSGGTRLVIGP